MKHCQVFTSGTWKDASPPARRTNFVDFAIRILAFLFFASMLAPLMILVPFHQDALELRMRMPSLAPPLTVITLSYGHAKQNRILSHNCAMISRSRHRFVIFTDDVTQPMCTACECRKYIKRECPCPADDGCPSKNPCEKLLFFKNALEEFREMVFLDDDLAILKDFFLDRLALRAQGHDFLATYGHFDSQTNNSYYRNFNSGLVFIRWLPGLDYSLLQKKMYDVKAKNDQGMISWFVHTYYVNWDTLSWKWHCRLLRRLRQDIPPTLCYTLHDRLEMNEVLDKLNYTLLTVP